MGRPERKVTAEGCLPGFYQRMTLMSLTLPAAWDIHTRRCGGRWRWCGGCDIASLGEQQRAARGRGAWIARRKRHCRADGRGAANGRGAREMTGDVDGGRSGGDAGCGPGLRPKGLLELGGVGAEVGGVFGDGALGGVVEAVVAGGSNFEGQFDVWPQVAHHVLGDVTHLLDDAHGV